MNPTSCPCPPLAHKAINHLRDDDPQREQIERIDAMLEKRPDPIVEVAPRVREMVYATHPLPRAASTRTAPLLEAGNGVIYLSGIKR